MARHDDDDDNDEEKENKLNQILLSMTDKDLVIKLFNHPFILVNEISQLGL